MGCRFTVANMGWHSSLPPTCFLITATINSFTTHALSPLIGPTIINLWVVTRSLDIGWSTFWHLITINHLSTNILKDSDFVEPWGEARVWAHRQTLWMKGLLVNLLFVMFWKSEASPVPLTISNNAVREVFQWRIYVPLVLDKALLLREVGEPVCILHN
jgi:hypothetical protein